MIIPPAAPSGTIPCAYRKGRPFSGRKRIPAEAGSSAAARKPPRRFSACKTLWRNGRCGHFEIGASVGRGYVPFSMRGWYAAARGNRRVLTPFRGMKLHLVVQSGRRLFQQKTLFSFEAAKKKCRIQQLASALSARRPQRAGSVLLYNALESRHRLVPEICAVKEALLSPVRTQRV